MTDRKMQVINMWIKKKNRDLGDCGGKGNMEDFELKEAIEELEFVKNRFYDFPEETGVSEDIKNIQNAIKAIKEFEEYKNLEKQGKLLRLPIPVGSLVYEPYRFLGEGAWEIDVHKIRLEDLEKIGKTVFLTRKEAEAALKELES